MMEEEVKVAVLETKLENFEWTQRPIVIFANSDKDPNFISQMELKSNNV